MIYYKHSRSLCACVCVCVCTNLTGDHLSDGVTARQNFAGIIPDTEFMLEPAETRRDQGNTPLPKPPLQQQIVEKRFSLCLSYTHTHTHTQGVMKAAQNESKCPFPLAAPNPGWPKQRDPSRAL